MDRASGNALVVSLCIFIKAIFDQLHQGIQRFAGLPSLGFDQDGGARPRRQEH